MWRETTMTLLAIVCVGIMLTGIAVAGEPKVGDKVYVCQDAKGQHSLVMTKEECADGAAKAGVVMRMEKGEAIIGLSDGGTVKTPVKAAGKNHGAAKPVTQ